MSAEIIQFIPRAPKIKSIDDQLPGTALIRTLNAITSHRDYDREGPYIEDSSNWGDALVTRYLNGEPLYTLDENGPNQSA